TPATGSAPCRSSAPPWRSPATCASTPTATSRWKSCEKKDLTQRRQDAKKASQEPRRAGQQTTTEDRPALLGSSLPVCLCAFAPLREVPSLRRAIVAEMTPRQIVQELDRYIVGQDAAKRAVAVAIRNRWRRQQLPPELRKDVAPKNIIMIGPTGVG